MKMVKVNYRGIETKEFLEDTSLLEISDSFKKYYNYPILVAKVDNDITGLAESVTKKSDIDFYDRSSVIGNTIYARSAQFILIVAVKQVLGEGAEVIIEHSIDKGVYCEIKNCDIDKPVLRKIESKMHEIVAEDLKFTKVSVSRIYRR